MATALFVLGTILYFLVCIGSLALLVAGLPGLWVIVVSTGVYAWASHGELSWLTVAVFAVMALVAEVFEAIVGAWGTKKYGGSKWGMLGAIIGGLAGSIGLSVLPVVGTLIGAFLGAFVGAFALEYIQDQDFRRARRSGTGAFMGKLVAVVLKGGLGVAMVISAFALILFR
jgi:uncharacterized protein